jgi:hypothetical protein
MARSRVRRNQPVAAPELPKSLEQVHLNAAGIDCGASEHYVAVPEDRDAEPVRKFGAFTADLRLLADWLSKCGIDTVAMESTGVYWIPLFELLTERGFEVKLVEPRKLKNVPGRKTDVLDCQWIQLLHTFGLLAGSFRPDDQVCVLRSYMRQYGTWVQFAAQHIQHMQKALEQMNVKLTEVINDITGLTGLRIIDAILAGERKPKTLAALRHENCKNDEDTIALALEGNWREEHLFALKQSLELYRSYQAKMAELEARIQECLQRFDRSTTSTQLEERPRTRGQHRNVPRFDMRRELFEILGVDLTSIDGFSDGYSALRLIAEIGTDVSAWPTEKHFASWLGLCPGITKTGGRRLHGRRPKNACRAAQILRLVAHGLHRAHCALGAFLRRMKARLGAPKAITATAHKLAKIVYNVLNFGKAYVDVGVEHYEKQYRERVVRSLRRRAAEMGFQLLCSETGEILA